MNNEIQYHQLKYIQDERGGVMHFLKHKDEWFKKFGECYFSWVNPGVIKGWYKHTRVTCLMTCPTTNLEVVLYHNQEISVVNISKDNYGLLQIPTGVWYAFKSSDTKPALIVNLIDEIHDPAEKKVLPLDTTEIPYDLYTND